MDVHFRCGYYPDLAHKNLAKRTEDYWDAYFYTWAVKVGAFKRPFYIHSDARKLRITQKNFSVVRQSFGLHIVASVKIARGKSDVVLVPVPSKDGIVGADTFRTLDMFNEAVVDTALSKNCNGGLRWSKKLTKAHEGGARRRDVLEPLLSVDKSLGGRTVVLVDDLMSTGGSLLAARDKLQDLGAKVLCAITCARTIYDYKTANFGQQVFDLQDELDDYAKAAAAK